MLSKYNNIVAGMLGISGMSGVGALLNRYTGNIVDWNRVGELLKSSHNYSQEELLIRASIIGFTVIGTYIMGSFLSIFLGFRVSYVLGFLISFSISHGFAIESLVSKRLGMKGEIETLKEKVILLINQLELQEQQEIKQKLDNILLSEARNNASSATLGMRKRLLLELLKELESVETVHRS